MAHYFENDQNLKSEWKEHHVRVLNHDYTFTTDHGVFSKQGLDFGTRTLLETLPLEEIHGKVLDLGCGYGPIGIALKTVVDVDVDMIDVNRRSLHLARMNADKNKVEVHIFESNGYENVSDVYDFIITNPPIRVGKKILYELLFGAKDYLKENGELWLVVHKDQGAKSLARDLEKEYFVEIKNKNKGFYIIRAKKREN